jgi:hypothetical protein
MKPLIISCSIPAARLRKCLVRPPQALKGIGFLGVRHARTGCRPIVLPVPILLESYLRAGQISVSS